MKFVVTMALCALAALCCVSADEAAGAAPHADDASAASPHTCGAVERVKIRRQWAQAFGEGKHRLEFARDLFTSVFRAYPTTRGLVKKWRADNIYSPQFQAFAQRLLAKFGLLIATTDDQPTLDVLLDNAKAEYANRGIKPEYLEVFRDHLLETLSKHLGVHMDWDAWSDCLNALIGRLH